MSDRIREIALVYASASEHLDLVAELEKLVQDEREACAKIVEDTPGSPYRALRGQLADAIRKRKP